MLIAGLGSMEEDLDPETWRKFSVRSTAAAYAAVDTDATLDIVQTYVPALSEAEQRAISAQVLESTLELYMGGEEFGYQDAERWEAMAVFMEGAGLLQEPVSATDAFTTSVLDYRTRMAE